MEYRDTTTTSEDDAGRVGADLFMAFGGVMLILLCIALTAMGEPEIKRSEVDAIKVAAGRKLEEATAHHKAEIDGLKAFYEMLEPDEPIPPPAVDWEKMGLVDDLTEARLKLARVTLDYENVKLPALREKLAMEWENRAKKIGGNLKARNLDLVIALDGSWSMTPDIDRLREKIEAMAEVLARVAPRFRLGIVVYLKEGQYTFPLQEIGPTKHGVRHRGMRALHSFAYDNTVKVHHTVGNGEAATRRTGATSMVSPLSGFAGCVDPCDGIGRGLNMLTNTNAVRCLCVIGDVGPWELLLPDSIQASERQKAKAIAKEVADFAGPDTRFVSFFAGRSRTGLKHKRETEQFFRQLADAAGEAGTYFDDPSQLAAIILSTCVRS